MKNERRWRFDSPASARRRAATSRGIATLRLIMLGACLPHCGEGQPQRVDANSHWLEVCRTDDDCGTALDCVADFCTRTCSSDSAGSMSDECGEAACARREADLVCLPSCLSNDCPLGFGCVDDACAPNPLDCASVETRSAPEEVRSRVAATVNEARLSRDLECSSGDVLSPVDRDPALDCAAQLLLERIFRNGLQSTSLEPFTPLPSEIEATFEWLDLGTTAPAVVVTFANDEASWTSQLFSSDVMCAAAASPDARRLGSARLDSLESNGELRSAWLLLVVP